MSSKTVARSSSGLLAGLALGALWGTDSIGGCSDLDVCDAVETGEDTAAGAYIGEATGAGEGGAAGGAAIVGGEAVGVAGVAARGLIFSGLVFAGEALGEEVLGGATLEGEALERSAIAPSALGNKPVSVTSSQSLGCVVFFT